MHLLDHLGKGGDLPSLWLGKVALPSLSLIDELRWREVLQPPALLPRFFEKPDVAPRLERLKHGMTVLDLLEEHV
jgi:hypothetical protein